MVRLQVSLGVVASWTRGPQESKESAEGRMAMRRRRMKGLREVGFLMLLYLVASVH